MVFVIFYGDINIDTPKIVRQNSKQFFFSLPKISTYLFVCDCKGFVKHSFDSAGSLRGTIRGTTGISGLFVYDFSWPPESNCKFGIYVNTVLG